MPITIYIAYKNINILIHNKDYELTKVKITNLVDVTDNGDYNALQRTRIKYQSVVDSLNTGKVTVVENSKAFEHFYSLRVEGEIYEVFGYKTNAIIGDEIWVWHNKKTKTLYAYGKNDKLDFIVFKLKVIISIL